MMRLVFIIIPVWAALLSGACSSCGKKEGGGEGTVQDAAVEDAIGAVRKEPVSWKDDSGLLKASSEFPFGTPIPVNMSKVTSGKTWCRYEGKWKVKELMDFYRKYLTLPENTFVEEKGRAFIFKDARPVKPGNPGRVVEVRVTDEKHRAVTAVTIFDRSRAAGLGKMKNGEKKQPYDPHTWKPDRPGDLPPDELL
ncbi:MAG: hypothetical protein ABIJ56_19565 [Pseudomonadota bacterium]